MTQRTPGRRALVTGGAGLIGSHLSDLRIWLAATLWAELQGPFIPRPFSRLLRSPLGSMKPLLTGSLAPMYMKAHSTRDSPISPRQSNRCHDVVTKPGRSSEGIREAERARLTMQARGE